MYEVYTDKVSPLLRSPPRLCSLGLTLLSLYLLGTQRPLAGALRELLGLGCLCPLLLGLVVELLHPCSEVTQLLHHARH